MQTPYLGILLGLHEMAMRDNCRGAEATFTNRVGFFCLVCVLYQPRISTRGKLYSHPSNQTLDRCLAR